MEKNKFYGRKKEKAVQGYLEIKKDQFWRRVYLYMLAMPSNITYVYYYIRSLGHIVALKIVAGVAQPSFRAACRVLGLLEDNAHWNSTLK
ncbi:hypothetical protein TNCT_381951 [Trichonephila clavata]|uniref:Uncharacterized protein n=1 Tax=Trichonephila clavata TaxID=2740835 RepID=A0A8X6J751_TRICU|nr:hypothetical protein TNCT_381951 [Trichonephila clavata]